MNVNADVFDNQVLVGIRITYSSFEFIHSNRMEYLM